MKFTVFSLNVSQEKGVAKQSVESVAVTLKGFDSDAHSGEWHRQISILDMESVRSFSSQTDLDIQPGAFGENITTEGIDLQLLTPGSRIRGEKGLLMEVTQVGKECHGDDCSIFRQVGKCIMPARGVFCRVLEPGHLHRGDILELLKDEETP